MDAELSAPEVTTESLSTSTGSSLTTSNLASNDDHSKSVASSVSEYALKANENSKTNVFDDDNGEGKFETVDGVVPSPGDVSDGPLVSSGGSNSILKDDSIGGGDKGLEEFRGEGLVEKFDIESVGSGENEEVEMGSIGVADKSVLSMGSGEEGRIGMDETNAALDIGVKVFEPVVSESVDYKAVEADGSKFSCEEELAVDATPLTGDALGIKESETKETEVVLVAGNASLNNGFDHASEQTSEIDAEGKATEFLTAIKETGVAPVLDAHPHVDTNGIETTEVLAEIKETGVAPVLDAHPPVDTNGIETTEVLAEIKETGVAPVLAYTFDAGPNAVLIARNRKAAAQLLQRLLFSFPPKPDADLDSYIIGDKSILQDAGLNGMKDVEALSPPPENSSAQKFPGDVSYFICTRPGKGPIVLSNENLALLDPETGLPK